MRSQILSQGTQPDVGEEVDGEPCVSRIIARKQTFEGFLKRGISNPGVQLLQPHVLGQLLIKDLDEYPGRAGGFIFIEMNACHGFP